MGKTMEVGDQGVWVTFARGMKGKAIRELNQLCEEVSCLSIDLRLGSRASAPSRGLRESTY